MSQVIKSNGPAAMVAALTPSTETWTNSETGVASTDPLRRRPSPVVREGDSVILLFGDGRQIFAHACKTWKGKSPPVKINKRSYPTANLIGLPYGTVLEVERSRLAPLPPTEGLIPEFPAAAAAASAQAAVADASNNESNDDEAMFPSLEQERDNRDLVDDNTSQGLGSDEVEKLRRSGTDGSTIVEKVCCVHTLPNQFCVRRTSWLYGLTQRSALARSLRFSAH
jgi:hypothetical protein